MLKLKWRAAVRECLRGELSSWSDGAVYALLEIVRTCTPPGALRLLEPKVVGAALARRRYHGHSLQLQAASVAIAMELTDGLVDWLSSLLTRNPGADEVMLALSAFARRSDTDLSRPFSAIFAMPIERLRAIPDLRYQLYVVLADAGMRRVFNGVFQPSVAIGIAESRVRREVFQALHGAAELLRADDAWSTPFMCLTDILRSVRPRRPTASLLRMGMDEAQIAAVTDVLRTLRALNLIQAPTLVVAHSPYEDHSPVHARRDATLEAAIDAGVDVIEQASTNDFQLENDFQDGVSQLRALVEV